MATSTLNLRASSSQSLNDKISFGFHRNSFCKVNFKKCTFRAVRSSSSNLTGSSEQDKNTSTSDGFTIKLPRSAEESVTQAKSAIQRAINDGKKRLSIELLLPLIGATDLDDWPGGIQQQFIAAAPLISTLLSELTSNSSPFGGTEKTLVDEGDAVVAWENSKVALLLFATADTLNTLESLAKDESRPLILANPQWQGGQVISDFGFGPKRRAAEEFVNTFEDVYTLKRLRVQSQDVRILKSYPSEWLVFIGDSEGNTTLVATEENPPNYKRLEQLVFKFQGKSSPPNWLDRLKIEFQFNKDSLK